MDGLVLFAIPLLMAAASHEAALAQQRYAAAQHGQPYVYAVPPGSGWAPGAVIGTGVGALAGGGHAGPALVGGLVGAAIGHAATTPPVYVAPAAQASPGPSRLSLDWNNFMQPSYRDARK